MQAARSAGLKWGAAFLGCVLAAGLQSIASGLDANWDLRNYHYYNAYAFLGGRLGWDVAPAMLQTYYNPLLDLPFWFLSHAIASARTTAFVMAAPAGVAAFCLLRMLAALLPQGLGDRALWIGCALLIGATGSMGLSVLGTTMNEWPLAMLASIALALLVRAIVRDGAATLPTLLIAGALMGIAAGLKLTYGLFALALVAALGSFGSPRERMRAVLACGAAVGIGFLAAYGFWGWTLWRELGNPFFPYFNDVFRSPWWEEAALFDRRFGPRDALQGVLFPLYFARESRLVAEVAFRDWRLATLLVLAAACGLKWIVTSPRAPMPPAWRLLAVFTLVAYLLWLKLFAIYRYLVPLEMLSGALIVGALLYLVPGKNARRAVIVIAAIALVGTTRKASWGRIDFGSAQFEVAVPRMAPDALVIVGPDEPMAYVIPFLAKDARFVSPQNNFLSYAQSNGLARRIARIVATHRGPVYSLDFADGGVDAVLEHYGLRRDASRCETIRSRLDGDRMRLCTVARTR